MSYMHARTHTSTEEPSGAAYPLQVTNDTGKFVLEGRRAISHLLTRDGFWLPEV